MPSATSKKEVPAVFARKRARSQAFGDEEDELEEDQLEEDQLEEDQLEDESFTPSPNSQSKR